MSLITSKPSAATLYFDSIKDNRQRSALLAIHMAWLDHSSPLAKTQIKPITPLDILLLYQSSVATFSEWPLSDQLECSLPDGGKIVNRDLALSRLQSISDPLIGRLAYSFASHSVKFSDGAENEQDLDYLVMLFLLCVKNPLTLSAIITGEIALSSDRMASDPDNWR